MILGQFIDRPEPHNTDALGFLVHCQQLVYQLLLSFIVISIFIFCFQSMDSKSRAAHSSWRIRFYRNWLRFIRFYHHFYRRSHLLTILNLIFIFYILFYYIFKNLIFSLIKTNEVILDVSQIIDSR